MIGKKIFEISIRFNFVVNNWVIGICWCKLPKKPFYLKSHFGPFSTTLKMGKGDK